MWNLLIVLSLSQLPFSSSSFVSTLVPDNVASLPPTPPSRIFGLPADFTFPPLNKPLVIEGVAQINIANEPIPTTSIRTTNRLTAPFTNSSMTKASATKQTKTSAIHPKISLATIASADTVPDEYWLGNVPDYGTHPFAPVGYQWFRNVKEFGAKGDGSTDDTDAINAALSAGPRCFQPCNSTSILGATVYFPPGIYVVSKPLFLYYYTQVIGNPVTPPTIRGTAGFHGIAIFDSDFYIPNGAGEEWYQNQNNFYRQIRNFVIDMTQMLPDPDDASGIPTGIHWQVAQATSLQNIDFRMPLGGQAQGIFMENGSGGFVSDLTFSGGSIGMRIGAQQFTMRNLKFTSCNTAIQTIWDWGWTFQNIQVFSVGVAIDARGGPNSGPNDQGFGSMSIIDSIFQSVNIVVLLGGSDVNADLTQILLDNVDIQDLPGSTTVVGTAGGQSILESTTPGKIMSWSRGTAYLNINDIGSGNAATAQTLVPPTKPAVLLDSSGNFYSRSKPQYEDLSFSQFLSVKGFGATGDGSTDDTKAINNALQQCAASALVCYFPMGVYMVTGTVFVPSGSKLVGIGWPQIMGSGAAFSDPSSPTAMIRVGNPNESGTIEISDLLFTVRGPTPGAVLVEWNIEANSQGATGMWDAHFRIGGAEGSHMQSSQCPKLTGTINTNCMGASLSLHITDGSSGYFENIWVWTSDHDMEIPEQTQIDVYSARGVLIESKGPTWLYGTASEHSTLYQYQLSNAQNVFLGFAQTETPYYQPAPLAPAPWSDALVFSNDPDYASCDGSSCAKAWAMRIINSTDVFVYGAGFYSFFDNYDQTCVNDGSETCQDRLIDIAFSEKIFMYDLVSLGAQEAVSPEGGVVITQKETQFLFVTTIITYIALAVEGADQGNSTMDLNATSLPQETDVIIDGATYMLPLSTLINVPESDGSTLTLGPGLVVVSSTTINIPSASQPTTVVSEGVSVGVQPGPGSSSFEGSSSEGDLLSALRDIQIIGEQIAGDVALINSVGGLWSAGSLSDASFSIEMVPLVNDAYTTLQSFGAELNLAADTFTLKSLTSVGRRIIIEAYDNLRLVFNLLSSLRKTFASPSFSVTTFRRFLKQFFIPLVITIAPIIAFNSFDFGETEDPSVPQLYLIATVIGTPLKAFQSFITTLPDGGIGEQIAFPLLSSQGYVTELTMLEAAAVKLVPIVSVVMLNEAVAEDDSAGVASRPIRRENSLKTSRLEEKTLQRRLNPNINLESRQGSNNHLNLLSQQPNRPQKDYLYDPSLGQGSTIYVIDSGISANSIEFNQNNLRTFTVPNSLSLPGVDAIKQAPADMTDYFEDGLGHGQCVASIAAGRRFGVASNANLVAIKYKNAQLNNAGNFVLANARPAAFMWAWHQAIQDAKSNRPAGSVMKAVINFSAGIVFRDLSSERRTEWLKLTGDILTQCWNDDIVTVVAAGNDGNKGFSIDDTLPGAFSQDDNPLIVVGGALNTGFLWINTMQDSILNGRRILVYAQAEGVSCASNDILAFAELRDGTSFAAPAIVKDPSSPSTTSKPANRPARSGLVAYFLGLSSLANQWTTGNVAMEMFQHITNAAFPRVTGVVDPNTAIQPRLNYRLPPSVPIAYNQAPDRSICAAVTPLVPRALNAVSPGRKDTHLPPTKATRVSVRQAGNPVTIPIVVSGVIVATDSPDLPVCSGTVNGIAQIPGYTYQGCFTDMVSPRVLPNDFLSTPTMAPLACFEFCSSSDFNVFGVENGNECWCGFTVSASIPTATSCTSPCGGDPQEVCGGSFAINVWSSATPAPTPTVAVLSNLEYLGCFTDNGSSRTLQGEEIDDPKMTAEECASLCQSFEFVGVEFSTQCFCGNSVNPIATKTNNCNMVCGDNNLEFCGGDSAINLYHRIAPLPSPTIASVNGWNFVNCIEDSSVRIIDTLENTSDLQTVEMCAQTCAGFQFMGVEDGNQCFCGSSIPSGTQPSNNCNTPCVGSSTEQCGGFGAMNLYQVMKPSHPSVDGFNYLGCFQDADVNHRVLGDSEFDSDTLKVDDCALSCSQSFFFGVEFGTQCFCGHSIGSEVANNGDPCNMICSGNDLELCGGSNAIDIYERSFSNLVLITLDANTEDPQQFPITTLSYKVFAIPGTNPFPVAICNLGSTLSQNTGEDVGSSDFPTKLGPFSANGATGCVYSGTSSSAGTLSCPGVTGIICNGMPLSEQGGQNQAICPDTHDVITILIQCRW